MKGNSSPSALPPSDPPQISHVAGPAVSDNMDDASQDLREVAGPTVFDNMDDASQDLREVAGPAVSDNMDDASQDLREDDEDDYEELHGGNRLLGFMFGNVDGSGDLDVDYLDEDAKEHFAALAEKLGPSLTDIDLIKSSRAPTDVSEQDYDEKAEDAIDYEDFDEQYDGPEIQATTEEDYLLPKKEYFSSEALLASLHDKASVFDEENYDEDEETVEENKVAQDKFEAHDFPSEGEQLELADVKELPPDDNSASAVSKGDTIFELEDFQEQSIVMQDHIYSRIETSLPVLCIEDGKVILRFSEIFGIHEPVKKAERKDRHKTCINKDWARTAEVADYAEDDEEEYLRNPCHNLFMTEHQKSALDDMEGDLERSPCNAAELIKDSSFCAQQMKVGAPLEISSDQQSPLSPKLYPLGQQDWEDNIIWGNSPPASPGCLSSVESESDTECHADTEPCEGFGRNEPDGKEFYVLNDPVVVEPFGSRNLSVSACHESFERVYHPQVLRIESLPIQDKMYPENMQTGNDKAEVCSRDALQRFSKLMVQNKELLEGSWLDQIIWDPNETIPKPKLILDLQDEQMLFEVLDHKDDDHLRSHASAVVISRSSMADSFDFHNQEMGSVGRFNISNDKYYSNRKTSQQAKSHPKKRTSLGIKIVHSVPALKLQTMKSRLSNKEIANFHRPKALWYPHDNEVAVKSQGILCTHGPMKIILISTGGKGIKLNANAEETLSSIKLRASKKLDFKPSEKVKIIYSGKELEDDQSLAAQNVRQNSVLHLVRTRIHVCPMAEMLPCETKPMRPQGAYKKKSDLSVKDGYLFLMEYCEERPLLLGNAGMGARLCTYYQKVSNGDQTASSLKNGNNCLGSVIALDPADKSPFLGDVNPGSSQSSMETNMYRAPVFPHNVSPTDYLLVRSAKGVLSIRRIDKLYVVGQQEPHMEVLSPGSKNAHTFIVNRLLLYLYREFRAKESIPLRADELVTQFPSLTDAFIRKRLKHCADLKKARNGQFYWVKRLDFRIPSEEELRQILGPENVCCYESMLAGIHRLKHLGINRLTHPVGLSSAMNQLPDEAIALAAASHIERELLITSWNLTSNFVACTNQDRENIERMEITGVGDPSGRGLGFSFVRAATKAPITSAAVKKKAGAARGGSSVTGTDADLRRLSMDAAREVLVKFNVPEDQIDKLTRWHRIAMVRKLSSEQASAGVEVDAMTLSKFARGQRMSFLQLQQQTREKCQEIWDRQVQSLSAADGDENDSDSEANSDLDSFAGDLENLLDAEEYEEEEYGTTDLKGDKTDGVKGFKMRRCPSQAQAEEKIEDDEAEAALILRLLEDDEEIKKKKKKLDGREPNYASQIDLRNANSAKKSNTMIGQINSTPQPDSSFTSKEFAMQKEVDKFVSERNVPWKVSSKVGKLKNEVPFGLVSRKNVTVKDGLKVFKEKKPFEKPVREGFVCGACGQIGHMRTNKNCPKYGEDAGPKHEDVETSEHEIVSSTSHLPEVASQHQLRTQNKKSTLKVTAKMAGVVVPENAEKTEIKQQAKIPSLKFKCGTADKPFDKSLTGTRTSEKQNVTDIEMESKSMGKINKIIFSNKMKSEDAQHEMQKPTIVVRPPVDTEKDQPRTKIIIKQPKGNSNVEQARQAIDFESDHDFRKMKKIVELSSFEKQNKQVFNWHAEKATKENSMHDRRLRDEEEKRRNKQRIVEDKNMRLSEERRMQEEHQNFLERRRSQEARRKEEIQKSMKKKKKKKKPDFSDEHLLDYKPYRNDRRNPDRDRAAKRRAVVDLEQHDYAPSTKRHRGGEVVLSNILEGIVDNLMKDDVEVSYLFLKPVNKKEAPDYLDIIERPMDLSTIKDKVRKMVYRTGEEFRHDIWQITYNAHQYNDGRNPGIPPLADQLLEICDYLLEQKHQRLRDAEAAIRPLGA